MQYHHELSALTEGKRYQIAALITQGIRPTEVARVINVHRSTVYLELRRNGRGLSYEPTKAHDLALQRRRSPARYRVLQDTIDLIKVTLSMEWSLEQIGDVCCLIGMLVSHEWIY